MARKTEEWKKIEEAERFQRVYARTVDQEIIERTKNINQSETLCYLHELPEGKSLDNFHWHVYN